MPQSIGFSRFFATETPEALEGLGLAAWWLDLGDVVFDVRERAYRSYRERGDVRGAARMAVWLAWDTAAFRGEQAIANGWLQRARRAGRGAPRRWRRRRRRGASRGTARAGDLGVGGVRVWIGSHAAALDRAQRARGARRVRRARYQPFGAIATVSGRAGG